MNSTTTSYSTSVVVGWTLSGLGSIACLLSAGLKILKIPFEIAGLVAAGYTEAQIPLIGMLLLFGVVLYLIPRTAFALFGAIWLTGYLGAALATHVINDIPSFLMPFGLAIVLWLGFYLRDAKFNALMSWWRNTDSGTRAD
jgi:uncharacterized membrane protein